MKLRLTLEYDGTNFSGWAAQPGLRTVEDELGRALAEVFPRWADSPSRGGPTRGSTPSAR